MPCKDHRRSLSEVLASGAELSGSNRAHLASCTSCRDYFAEQQVLFAAIDNGLHRPVHELVPASLLPRVRARVAEEAVPGRRWSFGIAAVATCVALFVSLILVREGRQAAPRLIPTNSPAANVLPGETPVAPRRHPSNAPDRHLAATNRGDQAHFRPPLSELGRAQVLIPSGEVRGVALLINGLRHGTVNGEELTEEARERSSQEVRIPPLEISPLIVKPLDEQQAGTR